MMPRLKIDLAAVLPLAALLCGCLEPEPAAAPSMSPNRSGPAAAAPKPEDKTGQDEKSAFSIFVAGDVFTGKRLTHYINQNGSAYPFSRLRDTIEKQDIAFANLEGPITERNTPAWIKKYLLRMTPRESAGLAGSGIDVVSLANNHAMDFGSDALLDTLSALEKMKIAPVGAGPTRRQAMQPAMLAAGKTSVFFLAYSRWAPPLSKKKKPSAADDRPSIAPLDLPRALDDIRALKAEPGRVVLVSLHWGEQHTEHPLAIQTRQARALIDAGADAVIGHHSHCPQGIEIYRGRPIFYSLGNFVFGFNNLDNKHNLAAVLTFDQGGALRQVELLPVHGLNQANRFSPYFLSGAEAEPVIRSVEKLSKKFGTKFEFLDGKGIVETGGWNQMTMVGQP